MKKQPVPSNLNRAKKEHSPQGLPLKPGPITEGKELGSLCHIFSGRPDENGSSFLETFNKDADQYGWTDAQRIGVFEDALVCEPRRWFRLVNKCGGFKNWKSVETEFTLRWGFGPSSTSNNYRWSYQDSESSDLSSAESDSSGEGLLHYFPLVGERTEQNAQREKKSDKDNMFSRRAASKNNDVILPHLDSDGDGSISDYCSSDGSGRYGRYVPSDHVFSTTLWGADRGEDLIFRDREGNSQIRPALASQIIADINDFISTPD